MAGHLPNFSQNFSPNNEVTSDATILRELVGQNGQLIRETTGQIRTMETNSCGYYMEPVGPVIGGKGSKSNQYCSKSGDLSGSAVLSEELQFFYQPSVANIKCSKFRTGVLRLPGHDEQAHTSSAFPLETKHWELGWAAIRGDGEGEEKAESAVGRAPPPSRGSDDPTQAYTTPTRRRARSLNANNAVTAKHIYRALRPTKVNSCIAGRPPWAWALLPSDISQLDEGELLSCALVYLGSSKRLRSEFNLWH
ncbi:hypothetical protein BGX38DRAFT_1289285 [Terfezia claveryi]|nr:hypothetical protein BGX38DRAFT_1289285 [Terfezia claveryi]